MVKTVLSVNHQGLTDWLIQRVSAVVMVFYSLGLLAYLVMNSPMDYSNWHLLFSHWWMKLATIMFILCILCHAWVGMWTIFTDYIKSFLLRFILQVLVFLSLVGFFFASLLILWGV